MKFISAALLLIGFNYSVQGQTDKTVTRQEQLWTGLIINYSFNNKHIFTTEIENRIFILPYKQSTTLYRFNYRIPINTSLSFSFGFANFYQWSQNDYLDKGDFAVPEYRPHVDFYHQHLSKQKKWKFIGRFRNEFRLFHNANSSELINGYHGYYRSRYRIMTEHVFNTNAKHQLLFRVGGEVHFNFGNEIIYNHFDQFRAISGFQLKLTDSIQFGAEYLYWYQHRASKNAYYQRDIFRILLNFTLSSKQQNK